MRIRDMEDYVFDVHCGPILVPRKVHLGIFAVGSETSLCEIDMSMESARTLRNQISGLLNSHEGRGRRSLVNGLDHLADGSLVGVYIPPSKK
jgi:hypothetical protein